MQTLIIGGAQSFIGAAAVGTHADAPAPAASATARLRILSPNLFDAAALTDSPAMAATLPIGNLQDAARARVARTVGLPAIQYLRGDWAAAVACNGFVLWRHNLSGAATLRFRLYAGPAQTGALLYDSGPVKMGNIIPYGEIIYGTDVYGAWLFNAWPVACTILWFASVLAGSFELALSDPANPAGYMQASRIFLGQYFSPGDNFSYGAKMRWEDDSTQERTDGGSLRTDTREPYRVLRLALDFLTEADRAALAEILRANGKSKDLFVSMHPGDSGTKLRDYSVAVKIIEMPDLTSNAPLNYQSDLVLAEA